MAVQGPFISPNEEELASHRSRDIDDVAHNVASTVVEGVLQVIARSLAMLLSTNARHSRVRRPPHPAPPHVLSHRRLLHHSRPPWERTGWRIPETYTECTWTAATPHNANSGNSSVWIISDD